MINPKFKQKGFTILEVLITVIIIGVLVAVAVSRYTQRSDDARYNTARSEMMQFVKAEQAIELDTGYYVSLRMLNEAHGNVANGYLPNNAMGWWEYPIEYTPNGYAIDTSGAYADGLMGRPLKWNNELAGEWNGPYIQFKQKGPKSSLVGVYTNDELPENNPDITKYGIPLDPWGSPYRLYGPYYSNAFNPGVLNPDVALTGFIFDRFAIVSYGKNTTRDFDIAPGSGNIGDDIIISF